MISHEDGRAISRAAILPVWVVTRLHMTGSTSSRGLQAAGLARNPQQQWLRKRDRELCPLSLSHGYRSKRAKNWRRLPWNPHRRPGPDHRAPSRSRRLSSLDSSLLRWNPTGRARCPGDGLSAVFRDGALVVTSRTRGAGRGSALSISRFSNPNDTSVAGAPCRFPLVSAGEVDRAVPIPKSMPIEDLACSG